MTMLRLYDRALLTAAAGFLLSALLTGAFAQAQTAAQPYATQGEWAVEFVPANQATRSPAHCRATKSFGTENALRFAYGDTLKAIDFMGLGSHALGQSFGVTYVFDNDESNAISKTAINVADNEGVEWIRLDESEDGPGSDDALSNTKVLTIRASSTRNRWQYPLAGTRVAINTAIECLNQRVRANAPAVAQVAPPAQAAPPAAAAPAQTQARPADCLLTINGRNYIDGRCQFETDQDGSFRVFGERHFAYVTVFSPGIAEGSWNSDPPRQSAQEPLGGLTRNGACWESQTVRICAWQLGQRPPGVAQRPAAPPPAVRVAPSPPPMIAQAPPLRPAGRPPAPGKSFYAMAEGVDVPSLCPDIKGGRIGPGTPIQMWQCHQQAPQRFGLDPRRGVVFAATAPHLCVDGDDKQQLMLVHCNQVRAQWRYDPGSKTIRSSNGLCWDIAGGNVPSNIRQHARVIAWRCHNQINQQFVLND